ncbi:RNA polymerase sigma factor [Stenotrophomonas maltophilia]|uniref:RNA polymerase sigma factor n=1 Tax=Stenotrophomonas maltophilia TaxID=40324 RepID=UPI0015DF0275|nr:RNA polymerase sigma factor [Stenotrophomonas maltophilia]MBA0389252.1 RNA polymerase sigma factor [Stenotrophomonas maltophilia]MBA0393700.1 RNA polymerase sigma factor [Stenotrophomonas maltophilia]MBA0464872.1 RNA polymerase sigma factor [Stenotrophomonas maltophilia]MBA0474797.1 RNA polymerase sigma factor [Stenotrophomonas maltophilia]
MVTPSEEPYPVLVSSPVPPSAETDALPASLEAFLASVGPRAFRFAEAGLRQREDAMDAVQDALLRMLDYADKPAAEWAPLFWSILRRRVIDLQRRRRFRLPFWRDNQDADGGGIDWADPGPDPAQAHEQRQQYQQLVQALRTLPARQREAFTLRVLQDLDGATTARAMGCSEGAVKTHLARARQALQDYLETHP